MSTKRETTTAAEKKTTVKKAPAERKTAAAPSKAKAATEEAGAAVPATEATAAKAKAPRARKAAAEKAATALTQVKAYIDVGPGNTLFLRGEGPGLSWEAGVPMQWTGDGCWAWSVETAGQEITFKVLINDQHWAWGDNLKVSAGDTASFTPAF
jgi:hypothetical protein